MSVAMALETIHFLVSHKSTKAESLKTLVQNGISKLVDRIQFINDFEATFLSSDDKECPICLNNKILTALIKFDPNVIKSFTQKFKGL